MTAPTPRAALPPLWRVAAARAALELRMFLRQRDAVVFSLALPVALLFLFDSIFTGRIGHTGVSVREVFFAGMIASGVASTSFMSLGTSIAVEREDGTLKRLAGTPLPKIAYFAGKAALVMVTGLAETVILLAIGRGVFGLPLPHTPGRWLTLGWVLLLGMLACALLGIAVSALPRSSRSASAVITFPFVLLQFVSGIYLVESQLPRPLQQLGAVFPLKWLAQGLRSAFLPNGFQAVEPAGSWEHVRTAIVLALWCLGGVVLCLRTFRWNRDPS